MDRSLAMSIFSSMDTGKLLQALSAIGINPEAGTEGQGQGMSVPLETWNARNVAVPKTYRPPLLNQENLTVKMPDLQRGREYLEPEVPGGYEDYMPRRPDVFTP